MKRKTYIRLTSLMLTLTLLFGIVAPAAIAETLDVNGQSITDYSDTIQSQMDGITDSDPQAERLSDLLGRLDEFDSFDAEERDIVTSHLGVTAEDLMSPAAREKYGKAMSDYREREEKEKTRTRIFDVYGANGRYSEINDIDRDFLFTCLGYDTTKAAQINMIFKDLESRGFGFKDSFDIAEIASDGLFTAEEALSLYNSYEAKGELFVNIRQFKQFAEVFDIEVQAERGALSSNRFRHREIKTDGVTGPSGRRYNRTFHGKYSSSGAFDEAKRLFVDGYDAKNIIAAYSIAAALGVDPKDVITRETEINIGKPSVDKAPVEETSAREVSTEEENSAEDTLAEEVLAEEAHAEEISVNAVFAEEAPTEEVSAEEAPAEEVSAEETLAEEPPPEEAPAENTPVKKVYAEETLAEEVLLAQYPCDIETFKEIAQTEDAQELLEIAAFGAEIMGAAGIMSTSGEIYGEGDKNIVAPFKLDVGSHDSISLNTGGVNYRDTVASITGPNGNLMNLDIVYDSTDAELLKYPYYTSGSSNSTIKYADTKCGYICQGWSFDIPYIEYNENIFEKGQQKSSDAITFINIPGRGSYKVYSCSPQRGVLDYPYNDIKVDIVSYTCTVKLNDGTVYMFSLDGTCTSVTDRFGYTIFYEYTESGKRLLSKIKDSLNQVILIERDSYTETISVTAPDNSKYVIKLDWRMFESLYYTLMDKTVDQNNNITKFTTQIYSISHKIFNKESKNLIMLLKTVKFPSGASVSYEYGMTQAKDPEYNYDYKIPVVSYLQYNDGSGRVYGQTEFEYSDNNYTGYPMNSSYSLFNSFDYTYTTTIHELTNNKKTKYEFNNQHLNTITDVTVNDVPRKSVVSEHGKVATVVHNHMSVWTPQPIRTTTTDIYDGFTRENIEMYEYDDMGNVTAYYSPKAEGGKTNPLYKTSYTYAGFNDYSMLESKEYKTSNDVTVREEYTPTADKKSIDTELIKENGTIKSRTKYLYDQYGNQTQMLQYPNVTDTASYIQTTTVYKNYVKPETVKVTGSSNIKDADGAVAHDGYVEDKYEYDAMWRVEKHTDPNGNVTRYGYDRVGRITAIVYPNGGTKTYDRNDSNNYIWYKDQLHPGAPLLYCPYSYSYAYDVFGNLTVIADYRICVTQTNTYDNRGRLKETRNTEGQSSSGRTVYTYDEFDRETDIKKYNESGTLLYNETYTYYDVLNKDGHSKVVKKIIGDANAPTVESYVISDKYGRTISEGVLGGDTRTLAYDHLDRVTNETSYGVNNTYTYNVFGLETSVRNIEGNTAYKTYDDIGRLLTSGDFKGNAVKYTYDALSRVIKEETPFEKVGNTVYYSVTKYYYDANGNVTKTAVSTNEAGETAAWRTTENVYDNMNQLKSTTTGNVTASYTYDKAGNVLTQSVGGAVTTYNYDYLGQLVKMTDALGQSESYTYDNNGLLSTKTDRNGTVFSYAYDGMGRTVSETAKKNGVTDSKTMSYTPTGQLRTETLNGKQYNYYYYCTGMLGHISEPGGIMKTYAYDSGGNRTTLQMWFNYIESQVIGYTYDKAGRLSTVKDMMNNGAVQATYTYDENGNRESLTYPNGNKTTYTYNMANMVTELTTFNGSTVLQKYTYDYYLDGNQASKTENNGKTTTYAYDSAGRLKSESATGEETINYYFDSRGNRTSMSKSDTDKTNYTYDLNNRLTSTTEIQGSSAHDTRVYSYDPNGNQLFESTETLLPAGSGAGKMSLSEGIPQGSVLNTYDVYNQLTSTTKDGATTAYTYRPDGLRASKTTNGVTTSHIWDGDNITMDITGFNIVRYIRGINLISAVGITVNFTGKFYYLHNAHGDVTMLTDTSGAVAKTYDYDAFGVEKNPVATDANPFRYAGEYYDEETESYYLRARYYNPKTGRFMTQDPAKDGLNWYTYCAGNPIMYVDPSGLRAKIDGANNENYRDNVIFKEMKKLTNYILAVDETGEVYIAAKLSRRQVEESGGKWLKNGNTLLTRMIEDVDNVTTIGLTTGKNGHDKGMIYFNPDFNNYAPTDNGAGSATMEKIPLHIVLAHELIHADRYTRKDVPFDRYDKDDFTYKLRIETYRPGVRSFEVRSYTFNEEKEELATVGLRYVESGGITENMIRADHGLRRRVGY